MIPGTARKPPYEHPPYRYVSSFVGFAPADNPRLATIVVIDEMDAHLHPVWQQQILQLFR